MKVSIFLQLTILIIIAVVLVVSAILHTPIESIFNLPTSPPVATILLYLSAFTMALHIHAVESK